MRTPSAKPGSGTPSSVSSPSIDVKRRRFLFSLSAGSAGAAVAAVNAAPALAAVASATAQPAQAGYRETDHVRDYYRTARL